MGIVAQLARALDWQSRGRGFESHLLHKCRNRFHASYFLRDYRFNEVVYWNVIIDASTWCYNVNDRHSLFYSILTVTSLPLVLSQLY